MIVDGFTFFNELDVLELRLTILDDVVDRFVLCESPWTFRGKPKPLVFAEHRDRFARWADRIVHLVYDAEPDPDPWQNEWGQRAHVSRGWDDVPDDALVMISDVDEIPDPALVRTLDPSPGRAVAFLMLLGAGYANRIAAAGWLGTKAMRRRDVGARTANDLRVTTLDTFDIVHGGWHFSLFGGPEMAALKIGAYSHVEADVRYHTDSYRQRAFYANEVYATYVPCDERFPAVLRDPRWSRHVWSGPELRDPADAHALVHAHGCLAYVPADARAVEAVTTGRASVWNTAGRERFGERFRGVREAADGPVADARDSWVVIDGFPARGAAELERLARAGYRVVLYTRNVIGLAALRNAIAGQPFPSGPAFDLPQYEQSLAAAGYRIAARDDIMDSIFPPHFLRDDVTLDVIPEPFAIRNTTRAQRSMLSTHAHIFTLAPV